MGILCPICTHTAGEGILGIDASAPESLMRTLRAGNPNASQRRRPIHR